MKKFILSVVAAVTGVSVWAATAPELKVYASARGGNAGTDSDATTAVTLTWVVSDYGTGASSTGPLILELSETSDFAVKTEVEVAASASGELPVTGTYKVTGLTAGAMRYARLRATNDQSVEGRSLVFPFSSLTTNTSTDWVSRGTVRYVDNQEGSDETGDGSAERPYATINRAAYHACKFDEIVIRPGKDYVLSETITFPNIPDKTEYAQLTIRSAVENEQVVIDGGGTMIGIDAYFGGVYYKDICVSNCVSSTDKVGAAIRMFAGGWGNAGEMWRLGTKIERCRFVKCRSSATKSDAGGGALYGKKFYIWDTDFIECESAYHGGAVFADNAGNASCYNEFRRCTFIRNVCGGTNGTGGDGGAIYMQTSGSQMVFDCTFEGNWVRPRGTSNAGNGGGIYGAFSIVSNCTFRGNYAPAGGGAFYQRGRTAPQVLESRFYGNGCNGTGDNNYNGGGAFYCWHDNTLALSNCVFVGNVSTNQAGGAAVFGYYAAFFGCAFTNNWSGKGAGAVRLKDDAVAKVERCDFFRNQAGGRGGAIYMNVSSTRNVTLHDCTFTENSASGFGGAIANGFMTNGVHRCTFTGNVSSNVASGVNDVARGGAVALDGAAAGQNTLFKDCTFSRNLVYGAQGGAIFANQGGIHLEDCTFTGNEVRSNGVYKTLGGGALALVNLNHSQQSTFGLHVKADRCKFIGNKSQGSSGAIDFLNSAGLNGAGTYTTIRNCLFDGNECTGAAGYGGVLVSKHGFEMSNCTLVNNKSPYAAGCIYLDGNYTAGITNCAFAHNVDPCNLSNSRVRRDLCWSDTSSSWVRRGYVLYNCYEYKDDPNAIYVIDACEQPAAPRMNFTNNANPFMGLSSGNLHLRGLCALINTGTNMTWMVGSTDLDNNPKRGRIAQEIVDIGCYEYWAGLSHGLMVLMK